MSAVATAAVGRSGRPLLPKRSRIVRLKVHRTISVDDEVDQEIVRHVQAHGGTYSGFVEQAVRLVLPQADDGSSEDGAEVGRAAVAQS
jgi:hypothetical protein